MAEAGGSASRYDRRVQQPFLASLFLLNTWPLPGGIGPFYMPISLVVLVFAIIQSETVFKTRGDMVSTITAYSDVAPVLQV